MKFWITCVFVVYGMVEIYQWMKHFTLPLPVFILGGAALAIASNYGKYAGWSFQKQATDNTGQVNSREETNSSNWATLNAATPALPKPTQPISFLIKKVAQTEALSDKKTSM